MSEMQDFFVSRGLQQPSQLGRLAAGQDLMNHVLLLAQGVSGEWR